MIKRLQKFASKKTGKIVKVTKILNRANHPSNDLVLIKPLTNNKLVGDGRMILADSLRRKYILI